MLQPFSGKKIQSRRNESPKWRFWDKMGVKTLDIGFATPKKALHCAEPRRLTYFSSKIGARVSAVAFLNKKLSYRRVTARFVLSVVGLILPITTQLCRNYLYDKS